MTKRSKINLLAVLVIGGGGLALGDAAPALAATFSGCESMRAALVEEREWCFSNGGSRLTYSGTCNSTGYTLSTTCYFN